MFPIPLLKATTYYFLVLNLFVPQYCEICSKSDFNEKTKFLQFDAILPPDHPTTFVTNDSEAQVHIISTNTQTVLIDIFHHTDTALNLTVSCRVQELHSNWNIKWAKWCYQVHLNAKETCIYIQDESSEMNGLLFHFFLDKYRGAVIQSKFKPNVYPRSDVSGYYWCELGNHMGKLSSAKFQIRDIMIERLKVMNNVVYQPYQRTLIQTVIQPSDLPYNFHCSNGSTGTSMPSRLPTHSPFSWILCALPELSPRKGMSSSECSPMSSYLDIKMILGEFIIHFNGTLTLLKMNPSVRNVILKCQSFQYEWINIIGNTALEDGKLTPVKFNPRGLTYSGPPEPMSSMTNSVHFPAGKFTQAISLLAIYRASQTAVFEWKKDDSALPEGFTKLQYQLIFPLTITTNLSGLYTLKVENSLTFRFNVTVDSPPIIINAPQIPTHIFAMDGGKSQIEYSISGQPSTKNIYIDGNQLQLDNVLTLASSITSLPKEAALKRRKLNVTVSPLGSRELLQTPLLTYSVENLERLGHDESGNSHTVTLLVNNSVGESRHTTFIHVFPDLLKDPQTKFPSAEPCDSSLSGCHFKCDFNFLRFCQSGMTVRRFWFIKGNTNRSEEIFIEDANKEMFVAGVKFRFSITDNNSTMQIYWSYNQTHSDHKSEALEGVTVSCRLLLFDPRFSISKQNSLDDLLKSSNLLFDSNKSQFHSKMVAEIKSDKEKKSVRIYIAIGIIIAAIVTIAAIIGLIRCRRRAANNRNEEDGPQTIEMKSLTNTHNNDVQC